MYNEVRRKKFISDNGIVWLFLIIGFSLFLLNETTRMIFSHSKLNQNFNILYCISVSYAIFLWIMFNKIEVKIILFTFIFIAIALATLTVSHKNMFHYVLIWPGIIFPLFASGITFEVGLGKIIFRKFLCFFNVICIIILILGIFDFLFKGSLQLFYANHILDEDTAKLIKIEHLTKIYRYYSLVGHPLVNAWYFLVFYTLNIINNKYYEKIFNRYLIAIFTLIGLVLCGSRTALIIGVPLCLMLSKPQRYRIYYYLVMIAILCTLFFSTMFQNNIMQRFVSASKSGDFSEGRNLALTYVIKGYVKKPGWIIGGGAGYSREITKNMGGFIQSFEYPFIMFAYDFSIIGTALIYLIILFIPIYQFLIKKKYIICLLFIAITIYINGFNCMANYTDYLGQLSFVIMLLNNIGDVNDNGGKKDNHEKDYICRLC